MPDRAGCARDCADGHTYEWGRCEHGVRRPPQLLVPQTWIADDGERAGGYGQLPLTLFAPWAAHLPVEDQHRMLADLLVVEPKAQAIVLRSWQRTAEQLADPARREVLLAGLDPAQFVEAPRPCGCAPGWQCGRCAPCVETPGGSDD